MPACKKGYGCKCLPWDKGTAFFKTREPVLHKAPQAQPKLKLKIIITLNLLFYKTGRNLFLA